MSLKQPDRVIGVADDNGPVWHGRSFHRDVWTMAGAEEPIGDGPVMVSKARWLAERAHLLARAQPVGLRLEPGEGLDDIAPDIRHFAVIALSFPKYSDGRAFSTAALLRDKHAYRGELRAIGNVLNDQIPLMQRVGFDSFAVTHGPTRVALSADRLAEVNLYYQPSVRQEAPAGTRPWLRRA